MYRLSRTKVAKTHKWEACFGIRWAILSELLRAVVETSYTHTRECDIVLVHFYLVTLSVDRCAYLYNFGHYDIFKTFKTKRKLGLSKTFEDPRPKCHACIN